jgi:hypothetical protein
MDWGHRLRLKDQVAAAQDCAGFTGVVSVALFVLLFVNIIRAEFRVTDFVALGISLLLMTTKLLIFRLGW